MDVFESVKVKYEIRTRGGKTFKKTYRPKRQETLSDFQRRVDQRLQNDVARAVTDAVFESSLPKQIHMAPAEAVKSVDPMQSREAFAEHMQKLRNFTRVVNLLNQERISTAEFLQLNNSGFPDFSAQRQDEMLKAFEKRPAHKPRGKKKKKR